MFHSTALVVSTLVFTFRYYFPIISSLSVLSRAVPIFTIDTDLHTYVYNIWIDQRKWARFQFNYSMYQIMRMANIFRRMNKLIGHWTRLANLLHPLSTTRLVEVFMNVQFIRHTQLAILIHTPLTKDTSSISECRSEEWCDVGNYVATERKTSW